MTLERLRPWVLIAALLRGPLLWFFRVEVSGAANLPGSGGVLLAANHLSYLDIFLVGVASPRTPRFIGKVELSSGFIGLLTRICGMVPVRRGRADLSTLDTVTSLLRGGDVIAVFPEGSRSRDGRIYKFRSGLGRLAASAQVPTVPVSLVGTADVWPRGSGPSLRRPPRGLVQIHFGEVIAAPGTSAAERRQLTDAVAGAIASRCGQEAADTFAAIA